MRAVGLWFLLLADVGAQERSITVQNLAPFGRREWAHAVVSFGRGVRKGLPDLHVDGLPTVWQPIGARWDDGSLRQALCLFPVDMKGLSEVRLPLKSGGGPRLPKLTNIDPLRAGTVQVALTIERDGTRTTARPRFVRELETNAARRVALYRARVGGTGFVFEFLLTSCLGQSHCPVDVGLFFSDPSSKAMQARVERVELETTGMRLVLRHARLFGMTARPTKTGTTVTLLRDVVVGDGQGIRRRGVLVPDPDGRNPARDRTLQAAATVPVLAATSWRGTGAYGPFGVVPEPPPWLRGPSGRTALARRHAAFVQLGRRAGQPFRRLPFMLAKDPGATGSQEDFGLLKLSPVASTSVPSFLLEVEPSILQEACRPVHFFETDGSPLRSSRHPDFVQWDGRAHWHCGVSKDRLGKPCPAPKFESHGWRGKDRQHWSSNYLCGYYLLTGSHAARREIENEVQLFLAGQTVKPGIATTGPGAPRAVGRMLRLGCWLYQCTGDRALLERMRARMQKSYEPGWAGRALPADRVRPLAIRGPASGSLGGEVRFWTPWEECIAVTGYVALHRLTRDAGAWRLAEEISLNVLRHGWLVDDRGVHVGYELRFQDGGTPLSREQMLGRDPTTCVWAGGGIGEWSMAAVEVALYFAKRRGDREMVAKAEHILKTIRQGRNEPPSDGWWDEYREWDALAIGR